MLRTPIYVKKNKYIKRAPTNHSVGARFIVNNIFILRMVRSEGIEPSLLAPEAGVLSTGLRTQINHIKQIYQ